VIFQQRELHCKVPARHQEGGCSLGWWVSAQRRDTDSISPERRQRLDDMNFVWRVRPKILNRSRLSWDKWYALLIKYEQRELHCKVPARHQEGGYNLGWWVTNQRKNRGSLLPERLQRLDEIGFVWDARLPRTSDN
jgi:hypothetical protein